MKNLLRIDAKPNPDGFHTTIVPDYFEAAWIGKFGNCLVTRRDLTKVPLTLPSSEQRKQTGVIDEPCMSGFSELLIEELNKADHVVINATLNNFFSNSILKAYLDELVINCMVVSSRANGSMVPLKDKSATLLIAYESSDAARGNEHTYAYITKILKFIGILDINFVEYSRDYLAPKDSKLKNLEAVYEIDNLFNRMCNIKWIGDFSTQEKIELNSLRISQTKAIIEGNAKLLAELCDDDIQIFIPGSKLILGRDKVLNAVRDIFTSNKFTKVEKMPCTVQRLGNVVVESGHQSIELLTKKNTKPRKQSMRYLHMYQKQANNWRYIVLSSSSVS